MTNGLFSDAAPSPSTLEFAKTLYKTPLLVTHRVRCGKPNCRCATGEGHGPYAFLYWREGTIQRRRYVRAADVLAVRAVVDLRRTDEQAERRIVVESLVELRRLRAWLAELTRESAP
jgi:hypothetical protein